jgi:hypothetical protein
MLDADLAALYSVPTRRLNEQVRRNQSRFPAEFMFKLTEEEWRGMFLQNARTSQGRRRLDRLPLAFTEHGCLMLSNVLNSPRAVEVSVQIVKAFVELRTAVRANHDLARRLEVLGKMMNRRIGKQDRKLAVHERAILKILDDIRRLAHFPEPVRRGIGFLASLKKPDE